MNVSWYIRRLRAMGPGEIARRCVDRLQEGAWRRRYFATRDSPSAVAARSFSGGLPRLRAAAAPAEAREKLLCAAERLLAGEWPTFAIVRRDATPRVNWHLDPKTGAHAPADAFAFDIAFVGGRSAFDTKYVWELSRHHHTTVLAMAWWLTGEARYARAAVAHIRSWIDANPFLAGVHWASGIELGLRLIAFSWTRRLLADWPEVRAHFDGDENVARCVVQHQWVLAQRRSHGSSANNHLLYETAGLYVSTCCMPWHERAESWRALAAEVLEREFARQVFAEGYSRELASDYNAFVLEALSICLVESEVSGHPLASPVWNCAARMFAWLGKHSDCRGIPPRQGDSDDASGLLLDAPRYDRWRDLGHLAQSWFGGACEPASTLRGWLFASLARPPPESFEIEPHPERHSRSGLVVLCARRGAVDEIWCAFDAGPLGFLSIAAHGHADALAIEVRYGGAPVLVDAGTYAYGGAWREYFRSTAAHNTLELGAASQSESGGPFLWIRHARARLLAAHGLAGEPRLARAVGEHDGYVRSRFRGRHRRSVTLDREKATLLINDDVCVVQPASCRMFFHLHPDIACTLSGAAADLVCAGKIVRLELPPELSWRAVRGAGTPGPGWYSPAFDLKQPTTTLVGEKRLAGRISLVTLLTFPPRP